MYLRVHQFNIEFRWVTCTRHSTSPICVSVIPQLHYISKGNSGYLNFTKNITNHFHKVIHRNQIFSLPPSRWFQTACKLSTMSVKYSLFLFSLTAGLEPANPTRCNDDAGIRQRYAVLCHQRAGPYG